MHEITAPPGEPTPNYFGIVASAGDVLAIGDLSDFFGGLPGRVYVYRRVNNVWTYETVLHDPDASVDSQFSRTATNGEVVLVGAAQASGEYFHSGVVHAWRYNGRGWVYEDELYPDGVPGYLFGLALDMDADVAVIGAPGDSVGGSEAGAAFVFRYDRLARRWVQEQKLFAFTPATGEFFGRSVSIHGDRLIVGAVGVDQARGAAYVFHFDGRKWVGEGELTAFDATQDARLGWAVHIHDNFAAAGASRAFQPTGEADGAVYTFVFEQDAWRTEAKLVPANPSLPSGDFGTTIASTADGKVLLIGCEFDSFGAFFAGSAYLFRRIEGSWKQTGKIGDPMPNGLGQFAALLTVNGDQGIVGAANGATDTNGAVFVFDGIQQRDCDGDEIVDACVDVKGPRWPVTPVSCEDAADLDGDGVIGSADVAILLASWGPCRLSCAADLDADGEVDGFDLAYVLGLWGQVKLE